MTLAENVFWWSLGFVAYTYAVYPVAVWLLGKFRPQERADSGVMRGWPSVTVVVAVHNEERRVARKLENLRALRYEPDKLEIVFVSDGSTDATKERLRAQPGVRLLSYRERRGKAYALNYALARVTSQVIVFTDVRQELEPNAVRFLVARLRQPGIGAVSGELVHRKPSTRNAAHIGLYWRYEKWIRQSESRVASTVGATGALYAIRRADYVPLPEDAVLDDLEIPMQILRRGRRVVFETRALAYDELQSHAGGERRRKVRTLAGNFQAFAHHPWMFSPWHNPVFIQFLSHKVFRLFVPYALAAMLGASLAASGPFYAFAAGAQLFFYAMSCAGMAFHRWRENRWVSFSVVFVELNWAAVLALFNFIGGRLDVRWEKT